MRIQFSFTILICLFWTGILWGCQRPSAATDKKTVQVVQNDLSQVNPKAPQKIPLPSKNNEKINKNGLVELIKLDDSIKLDIRYATDNNFVGKKIYQETRAFLQRLAAASVVKIHQELKKQGLGLVIFDGYRPLSATKLFWEITLGSKKKFVASPKHGSRHNRGCAVDLSLFDLQTGKNLDMPTNFDDFTPRAAIDYNDATEQQRTNREILRKVVEANGFKVYSAKWWHYDFQNCPESRILNIPFSEIK